MKALLLVICVMLPVLAGAQSDWSPLVSKDGVVVFYKNVECNGSNLYVLKFENNNSCDVSLVWDLHVWVDNECMTCADNTGKNHCILSVPANSRKTGSCKNKGDNRLCVVNESVIYKTDPESKKLSNLQLANFRVLKLGG